VTTLDGSVEAAYVFEVPSDTTEDEVRSKNSKYPFVRYLGGDDKYAYSSFIAEPGEDPQITIDKVKESFGFEKIYDESSCTTASEVLCHEYRAHNSEKGRVYLGRVYVAQDPSGVYTGHSLIASTTDDKEITDDGFVSSFKVKPLDVMKQCQRTVSILEEEFQGVENNSNLKEAYADVAQALENILNGSLEVDRLIGELAETLQALSTSDLKESNKQELMDKATSLDDYCYR
jgi:hypothetical protein